MAFLTLGAEEGTEGFPEGADVPFVELFVGVIFLVGPGKNYVQDTDIYRKTYSKAISG